MKKDINQALANVEITYDDLLEIANNITSPIFSNMNQLVNNINENINNMTPDSLTKSMLKLSTLSYQLSEIKDKAILKQSCAETLKDEKYSKEFTSLDGSVAVRENQATINCSEEILVDIVYSMVASSFKTKLDEGHRLIDTLKSILMYKMVEMRQTQTISLGEPGEQTYITE